MFRRTPFLLPIFLPLMFPHKSFRLTSPRWAVPLIAKRRGPQLNPTTSATQRKPPQLRTPTTPPKRRKAPHPLPTERSAPPGPAAARSGKNSENNTVPKKPSGRVSSVSLGYCEAGDAAKSGKGSSAGGSHCNSVPSPPPLCWPRLSSPSLSSAFPPRLPSVFLTVKWPVLNATFPPPASLWNPS